MVMFYRILVGLLFICIYSAHANASVEFHHADWHITCDNTLTCYAVGYAINNDSDAAFVSKANLLLIRHAGEKQSIDGVVKINVDYPSGTQVDLLINDHQYGPLTFDNYQYKLNENQVNVIINSLKSVDDVVMLVIEDQKINLSSRGFNATMLKMDDVQGRVGTVGAIIKKGAKDESEVYPAAAIPVINRAAISNSYEAMPITYTQLLEQFPHFPEVYMNKGAGEVEECDALDELTGNKTDNFFVDKDYLPKLFDLDDNYQLVEVLCSASTTRNQSNAYWLVNKSNSDSSNQELKLITRHGMNYNNGLINEEPGLDLGFDGDGYIPTAVLQWDGADFVLREKNTVSGDYSLAGGKWILPLFISHHEEDNE